MRRTLRRPIRTAQAVLEERGGFFVCLRDDDGRVGRGEVAPLPGFGTESETEAEQALSGLDAGALKLPDAPGQSPTLPEGLGPCVRFGLETALLDLAAQRAGVPLHRWLGGDATSPRVAVNALLAEADPRARVAEALAARRAGFSCLKLKLVGAEPEALEGVRALRRALGAAPALRVDWNQGLDARAARRALETLRDSALEYVEQPLPADQLLELRSLREIGVPIAADESASDPEGLARVLSAEAADVVVLKPATLGGLLATRAWALRAANAGVGVTITSLLDGAVAHWAGLHLVASLPGAKRAAGLGSAGSLRDDVLPEPPIDAGCIALRDAPGLGIDS